MFKRIAQKLRPNNPTYFDRIRIEYGEILSQTECESILFFIRPNLEWGGSLNRAVLEMAGPALDEYVLENIPRPRCGEVYALPSCNAPYKALFMAVLADWDGGNGYEERDLLNCYRETVEKAQIRGIKSVAIPAMGHDKRDFPHIRFARVALRGILEKLDDRIDCVKIMCIDRTMVATYNSQIEKMKQKVAP